MPPISCTSKWRWPSVRLAASRTVAKAGTRRSSSGLPSASCSRNSSVRARSCVVGERRELGLQRVDRVDAGLIGLDAPVVGRAENLAGEGADHRESFLVVVRTGIDASQTALRPPGDRSSFDTGIAAQIVSAGAPQHRYEVPLTLSSVAAGPAEARKSPAAGHFARRSALEVTCTRAEPAPFTDLASP